MRASLLKSAARCRLAIAQSSVEGSPVGALLTLQRTKRLRSTAPTAETEPSSLSSDALIGLEGRYVAHNYKPLPVVVARAQGAHVWDPEGKEYLDFLSAYSAVNQGHCHPAIVQAAVEQLSRVTLTSRAFYNDQLPRWARSITSLFHYDAVLPMNTGAEAVETAVKLARRWGSIVKKVPDGETVILAACGSFHGRTLTAISLSSDEMSSKYHGPLAQGVQLIPYGDVEALRRALKSFEGRAVGFIVEPIQGEGGVLVPPEGYLRECHEACRDHGALLIADEVQTGVARTGRMLASEWDGARPDMVVLGKALGGGVYPISCVLADEAVMGTVTPGVHGSTFGGNPLGCAVSTAALQVVADEALVQRAAKLGEAIELDIDWLAQAGKSSTEFCSRLKDLGVLAKATHESTVRFAPPIVISEEDLRRGTDVIAAAVSEFESLCVSRAPDAPKGLTRAQQQRESRTITPCHRAAACCVHFA